jgi:hypothetical protein
MANKEKCKEKDVVRVCSRWGTNSRQCKRKIKSCQK